MIFPSTMCHKSPSITRKITRRIPRRIPRRIHRVSVGSATTRKMQGDWSRNWLLTEPPGGFTGVGSAARPKIRDGSYTVMVNQPSPRSWWICSWNCSEIQSQNFEKKKGGKSVFWLWEWRENSLELTGHPDISWFYWWCSVNAVNALFPKPIIWNSQEKKVSWLLTIKYTECHVVSVLKHHSETTARVHQRDSC